jgi:Rrf2 family protein
MPISTKGEYAARALLHLALASDPHTPIKTGDIAAQQRIPKKYLEQILLLFKHAGFVQSKPSLKGGYFLARPASEITMAQMLRAVDGPLAPVRCVSQTAYAPCPCAVEESTCALRSVWQEARDAMVGVLDRITLQDLADRARAMARQTAPTYAI